MMSGTRLNALFISVLLCLSGGALAADAPSDPPAQPQSAPSFTEVERSRIERERAAEMRRQQQVESGCYQRFAVNACLLERRVKHRELMADLKRQEIALNDRERRLRSSEQLRRIEDKVSSPERDIDLMNRQQQGAQKATDAANTAAQRAVDAANQTRERAERQAEQQRKQQQAVEKAAERASKAAQAPEEARRFQDKLQDAASHRQQVERDAKSSPGPRGAPLPVPAEAGSAPAVRP